MITNFSSGWAFQKRTSVVESDSFSRPDIGNWQFNLWLTAETECKGKIQYIELVLIIILGCNNENHFQVLLGGN
jgi:hypothetical protein